jgi:hypothetical protein
MALNNLKRIRNNLLVAEKQAQESTLKFARSITPKLTGNARKNTNLKNEQIQSQYPYARRLLIEGWSKQLPPNQYIKRVREHFRQTLLRIIRQGTVK